MTAPVLRPVNPRFSSGPCPKPPSWSLQAFDQTCLGRSHRSLPGRARLKHAIDLTAEILKIPADYRVAIVPGSDTGAMELAFWSLLGPRGIDVLAWESFGEAWAADIVSHLRLEQTRVLHAPYGEIADLASVDFDHDVIFTWNGTTSGVRVPHGDWIAADRKGPHHLRCDPRRHSRSSSTGRSSTSSPSRGRRRWAAKPRMACSS